MVVEYIRYRIDADLGEEFERACTEAGSLLTASSHCRAHEVARGVEDPETYIVRIEWDSIDGHERGFRTSAEFGEFLSAVKPFFDDIQEMRHYELLLGHAKLSREHELMGVTGAD
jgi:heme-degrading monooxygenase HmoA